MKKIFFITAFSFILFSCTTTKINIDQKTTLSPVEASQNISYFSNNDLIPQTVNWEKIQEGFYKTSFHIKNIKVHWTCIKIDLSTPNLRIAYQPNENTLGNKFQLKKFAKQNKTIVAINTTPFDLKGKTYLPVGITKYDNKVISPSNKSYCALCFYYDKDNQLRANILPSQIDEELENYPYAFGGFFSILIDNKIQTFEKSRRSRVACGINQTKNELYLFVTTPDFHIRDRNGLNYEECAFILQKLGCSDAMQFDGGHSSGLCIYDKNIEVPFLQRKVPTAIGFYCELSSEDSDSFSFE